MPACRAARRASSGATTARASPNAPPCAWRRSATRTSRCWQAGSAAWEAAGFRIYSGVHVPSKAFAEVVEHEAGTPWITAEQLKELIDARADIALFDSRSYEEFHGNSIPTAISVPGAELVYRFADLVPSPETMVVVNCGGRTRSIIGAQSLINAGVPNKVVSLKNGTQAWHLAGFPILKGSTARPPAVSPAGHAAARASGGSRRRTIRNRADRRRHARAVAGGVDNAHALRVRCAHARRSIAAGHIPGMKNVPGGQLVQETDRHAATWGARVVLVDDDGVRAVMTAHWMKQMGWDAAAMTVDMRAEGRQTGAWTPRVLGLDGVTIPTIDRGVVAGAHAGRRRQRRRRGLEPRLSRRAYPRSVVRHPGAPRRDPAATAAVGYRGVHVRRRDAREAGRRRRAGEPHRCRSLRSMAARQPGARRDSRWSRARPGWRPRRTTYACARASRPENVEEAMRAYLSWEIDLADQMAADDDQRFRILAG